MPFPTPIRRAGESPSAWPTYKSKFGPKYSYQPEVAGITGQQVFRFGLKAGAFGGVALFAVIFYASGIPRLQNDILMKVPFIRNHYIKDVPASDNPF